MQLFGAGAHGADEPRVAVLFQRKDGKKIARVQRDVQLAVHRRAARFDVGDVEQVIVRAARETDRQRLPHRGTRAVAAGDEGGLARLGGSVRPLESREHTAVRFLERHELCLALDFDAGLGQAVDQQALVLVLRKDQHVRKRTDTRAHVAEGRARHLLAGRPEIDGSHLPSAGEDRVREADLTV